MNTSSGTGPINAKIAIVYDKPRDQTAYLDLKVLKTMYGFMNNAGIKPHEVYQTSLIKDQTPFRYFISQKTGGFEFKQPIYKIIDELQKELNQLPDLKVVVPMGNTKATSLGNIPLAAIANRWGINSKWPGSVFLNDFSMFQLDSKPWIAPNYHPIFIIQGNKKFEHLWAGWWNRIRRYSEGIVIPTERETILEPSYKQVIDFLHWIIQEKRCAFDIENIPDTGFITCFSFSQNMRSMSIPLFTLDNWVEKSYFTAKQEEIILRLTKYILENPDIEIIGQNIIYDSQVMFGVYGIRTTNMNDTIIAQNILCGEHKKDLGFIAVRYFADFPYHKGGIDFMPEESRKRKFWLYNATDTLVCDGAFPKQEQLLKKDGNWNTYLRQRSLISPLVDMNSRGILVNSSMLKRIEKEKGELLEQLKTELLIDVIEKVEFYTGSFFSPETNKKAQKDLDKKFFNRKFAKSSKQLTKYFNFYCKAKQYKTKQKKYGFDDLVMQYLGRDGHPEAKRIIAIRKLITSKSTFYNSSKINKKGRFAASFSPSGTFGPRLSSKKSIIDGSGQNLQNLPGDFKQVLIPDVGYTMYEIDLAQAEKLVTIYYANARRFIDAYEAGICLHCLTAEAVTGVPWQKVLAEYKDGNETLRKIGKMNNFAWDYGASFYSYSRTNMIPLDEAKQHYIKYHAGNPEIKNNFWASVQRQLKQSGRVENLFGRKQVFHSAPWEDSTFRIGYNGISQGTVGDLINEHGMRYIWDHRETTFKGLQLLSQVHDSLYFQIPNSLDFQTHAKMLIAIKKSLEKTLTCPNGNTFFIPCDLCVLPISMSKKQGKEIKAKDFSENSIILGNKLVYEIGTLKEKFTKIDKNMYLN